MASTPASRSRASNFKVANFSDILSTNCWSTKSTSAFRLCGLYEDLTKSGRIHCSLLQQHLFTLPSKALKSHNCQYTCFSHPTAGYSMHQHATKTPLYYRATRSGSWRHRLLTVFVALRYQHTVSRQSLTSTVSRQQRCKWIGWQGSSVQQLELGTLRRPMRQLLRLLIGRSRPLISRSSAAATGLIARLVDTGAA